jgi:hypothetical protein
VRGGQDMRMGWEQGVCALLRRVGNNRKQATRPAITTNRDGSDQPRNE